MTRWFEDLSKTMADEHVGRRTALRRMGGTLAGVAFASALPGIVQAKKVNRCPLGGSTCSSSIQHNCTGIPNINCFCFTGLNRKPVCGCNSYCSQIPTCSKSSACPKGYVCIVENGCNCGTSPGVCVPNCVKKKYRNCQLGSGHGATAAGGMS